MTAAPASAQAAIAAALAPAGLLTLAIVRFTLGEGPLLTDGRPAASLALVGNAGGSLWPAFSAWRRHHADVADPLDSWSKAMIGPVAASVNGTAWYPSDPPYQPFQRWAAMALGLKASPLGILIHPEYGPWFGFRGAIGVDHLLQDEGEGAAGAGPRIHPCDICEEKPCLTHCPVGAVTPEGFAVGACRAYLASAAGQTGCMTAGCLARNACPVGAAYRYPADQLRFHMGALRLPEVR